jgi:hypothetical protein
MKSIADFNNDGLPDLLVANDVGNIVWYENPSWTRRVLGNGGPSDSASAVGDLDRDGDEDAVVGQFWYENVGLGSSFSLHWMNPIGLGTHDSMILDINRDGKPDVVSRGESLATVRVYLQQGTPSDYNVFELEPGVGRNGLDIADINRDGRLDVVVGGVWMEQPVDISTAWIPHTFASWNNYASVVVKDINRDGLPDVVLGVSEGTGSLSWFEAPAWTEHVIDTNLTKVHAFVVADIDHNGTPDVAASEYEGAGRLVLYLNQGTSWSSTVLGTDALHNVRGADLNNDGTIDFFGANAWGSVPVIAYLSDSSSCSGTGGAGGSGGSTGGALTGGAPTGGTSTDGSTDSSAGGASTGGVAETGGAPNTGGTTSTGGAEATGGAETGGAVSTGGAPNTGGVGTGGTTTITLGETAVVQTDDYGNGDLMVSMAAELGQTATIQSLTFYVTVAAGNLRLGIYDSTAQGDAHNLKAETIEFTPVVGWNTVAVATPTSLSPGRYWLTYQPSSSSLHFRSQPGSGSAEYYPRSFQPFPATYATNFSTWPGHWSFYATLTVP